MRQRKRASHGRFPGEATPFMKGLQSRVLRFVRRHGVLNPGERALLAVSGGPDSGTLLLIAAGLAAGRGGGVGAAGGGMGRAWGLALGAGSGVPRARGARRRESIEEGARNLRFAFLGR